MKKILILLIFASTITGFILLDLGQYLSLEQLKNSHTLIQTYYQTHPVFCISIYFAIYIAVAALSLPGAGILTLAAGAVFGFVTGIIIVSFASTIGSCLAFLMARLLLRDHINNKFGRQLSTINAGIQKDGAFYLFTIRLIPIFPFFIVNLLMGLTPMTILTFAITSQAGMLLPTAVIVNAGTQLAKIDSLSGIFSLPVLGSFILLGVLPLIIKKLLDSFKKHRIYQLYRKPDKFDYNLVVIGGGSAGLVSAYIGATVKAKTALIEKHKMGGDCLNTGCIPSKTLIRSAKFKQQINDAKALGFTHASANFEFRHIMQRIQHVIKHIEPHDSAERYSQLGVDCIQGDANIISPWEIQVDNRIMTSKNIVIATGARPFVPTIPGIEKINYLTSDTIWELQELPRRLLILGGGPVGCELAQAFNRLGSQVTQIEMLPDIMRHEDKDVIKLLTEKLIAEGVDLKTGHKAIEFLLDNQQPVLLCEKSDSQDTIRIEFDQCLIAIGRRANTEGLGLEKLGIQLRPNDSIDVNDYLQTQFPNIYACGDVTGPYQFTHTAAHQAWYCTVNALFGHFRKFKVDYRVIPWTIFTEPEIARVGLNEADAKQQNIHYEVTIFAIDDLDRAITDNNAYGFIKVLTVPGKDKILGVTIVGEHAGDLLAEFVLAMQHKLGLNKILGTIHSYPTMAEANKYVAGEWKRQHAPETLLHWIKKYHRWVR